MYWAVVCRERESRKMDVFMYVFIYLFMKEQVGQSEQISQLVAGIKMHLKLNFWVTRNLVSSAETSL